MKAKKQVNIDDLLNDVKIDMGLTLGTLSSVPVFSKELGDRILLFANGLTKLKDDILTPAQMIALLKQADALIDDIEASLKDIKAGEIRTTEKKKTDGVLNLIGFIVKRYILIPSLLDEATRKDLTARLGEIPDENAFKPILTEIKEDDTFTLFDSINLIGPDLITLGKMKQEEVDKMLEGIAYEESRAFEELEGPIKEDTLTERQKRYVRLRMGYDKE